MQTITLWADHLVEYRATPTTKKDEEGFVHTTLEFRQKCSARQRSTDDDRSWFRADGVGPTEREALAVAKTIVLRELGLWREQLGDVDVRGLSQRSLQGLKSIPGIL